MYSNKAVRLLTLSSVSVPGSVMTMLTMSSVFVSRCYDAADPVVCLFWCLGLCYDAADNVVCLFWCLCVMMLLTMSSVCFWCLGLCYDAADNVACLFWCFCVMMLLTMSSVCFSCLGLC